jgi:rhamnosyl/mannosyltransferase
MDHIKVLHIYNSYYPPTIGGIEKHINTLCEGLKTRFNIRVLVTNNTPVTKIENINEIDIIRVGTLGTLQSAPIAPFMPLWLKKLDTDILHFHIPCPTAMISYFLAKPKGKIVVTYHSDIVRQKWAMGIYRPLVKKLLSLAAAVIATSPNYINSSEILNGFRNKCTVIPLGIDTLKFKEGTPKEPTILFAGKLRYYKGLEYLIKAMQNVNAKLNIIGTGTEYSRLRELTANLKLNEKIFFLGDVSEKDLPAYFSSCSIFVLPSIHRSEAFGIVQLEAMASGKPVVSTNLDTGVTWINQNNKTGIIVPTKDVIALENAINKLLNDKKLLEELGQNAKSRAEKEFNQDLMLNRTINLYNSLF